MPRRSLPDLDREELALLLAGWNEPAFRVGQIWHAVYQELVPSYDAITTLPRPLRARLAAELPLDPLQAAERLESADKRTEKVLFRLADGETIEAVLMRYDARRTVCLSTQVGCAIGCPFCATGRAGFRRDLTAGEIVSQVLHFARELRAGGSVRRTSSTWEWESHS